MSTNTIEHDGHTYPTEPRQTTSMELYSVPSVSNMWIHYVNGAAYDMHFLYVGQCGCGYCDYQVWREHDAMHVAGNPSDVINVSFQAASREEMEAHGMLADWEHDFLPVISKSCMEHNLTRRNRAKDRARLDPGRHNVYRMRQWPESLFTTFAEEAAKKAEEERKKYAEWITPHPVEPKPGAFLWINDQPENFDGWTDERRVKVKNSTETYDPKDVLTLTSIVYGVPHENVVVVPGKGYTVGPVKIMRYSGYTATIEWQGESNKGRRDTLPVNALALAVPTLDPSKEGPKAKSQRLERELKRLQEIMHRRMVAEGEARSWCSEFDPILDSSGLKPRKAKVLVRGTIVFEYVAEKPLAEQTLTKLKTGSANISSHIPLDKCVVTDITQSDPMFAPVLS